MSLLTQMKSTNFRQVTDFGLKLLRIFKTLAECGSFSAAESSLGVTRSAISLHMNDLEKRLGMRLCQRGRAGFSLTDEGREILCASETIMASIEEFRQHVNQMHKQYSFLIKVFALFVLMGSIQLSHAENNNNNKLMCKNVSWQPI
ncbi:LysR family transcriptional regulator [Xenorhabdus hominickii]|uniref:DNA-binding transcriptional activator TdcA n=1 Tax=Xenorhabdus hominickii TaxID=351679 RepID=A0A2G0Q549_XENHO|nr:LysR family transcriptional regulator [Xenorhabdus hominickii]PHM51689.1 DNA-binding transcriptional activator TdcA [Xenorhabdus hominickii]PHM54322.1 DNA-binding transcriptional activator TdcA [Xenorhabdus hominickii]